MTQAALRIALYNGVTLHGSSVSITREYTGLLAHVRSVGLSSEREILLLTSHISTLTHRA